jgi:hypothetical protein
MGSVYLEGRRAKGQRKEEREKKKVRAKSSVLEVLL